MKSKNISIIQFEGVDGVGKTTLLENINKQKIRSFAFCDRGDLSDYVYRKEYGGNFTPCVINQNVLIVLLIRKYDEICRFIIERGERLHWSTEQILAECDAAKLQNKFIEAASILSKDYNILTIDVTGCNEIDTFQKVMNNIFDFIHKLPCDTKLSEWNKIYEKGCKKLGLEFNVRDNQPYINDVPFMSELTNQFGVYETYTNKSYPTNLIYSLGYDISDENLNNIKKCCDFEYVINSKINRRPEVYEYYHSWDSHGYKFMISKHVAENKFYSNAIFSLNRIFGDEYLTKIAMAKATVYTSRDLAPYKMQTARLYESIKANQIVFVDIQTDSNNEILSQIHKNDRELIVMLRCTPETICEKYQKIITDKRLCDKILDNQHRFYKSCIENIQENNF